mgnify:CR=1 FL=1|tara:strand:- start:352 stop:729 length:378 start_codon:yes stop_codon:yes gene_type:complete
MNNLIIDTAGENIFLKIISQDKEYNIKHNNSRENFDKLVILVFNFLNKNKIDLSTVGNIFVNQGPGKYSSIRSAISLVKAIKISSKANIYGYYTSQIVDNNYDNLLKLLEEGRLTKNFIQPKYLN